MAQMPLRNAVLWMLVLALICAAAACGPGRPGSTALPLGGDQPRAAIQEPAVQDATAAWPGFPPQPGVSPVRLGSDSSYAVAGTGFAEQSPGSSSYADSAAPGSYVLVPLKGGAEAGARLQQLAWVRYAFAGITGDRPVSISLDAAPAPAQDGGSPVLPLKYYVGVSNYTHYQWEWSGPYTAPAAVVLSAAGGGGEPRRNDRYVDAAGLVHCIVLVDSAGTGAAPPDNPRGLVAAKIVTITLTTASNYQRNKPHFPVISGITVGGGHGAASLRRASALSAEQFLSVSWPHVSPFSLADEVNEAKLYRTYRQELGLSELLLVGERGFAGFTDPVHLLAGVDPPQVGHTYRYFVTAANSNGETPPCVSPYATVPILPPLGVNASLNGADDGIRVNWQAVEGALRYEVWRGTDADPGLAQLLSIEDAPTQTYFDSTAVPATFYWYYIRAVCEGGALGPFGEGARGLRKVLLSLFCTSAGIAGHGLQFDPYLVSSGTSYTFSAHDQIARDLTNWLSWSAVPSSAASFTLMAPGVMTDVDAGAGLFQVEGRLSFSGYTWSGLTYCEAQP